MFKDRFNHVMKLFHEGADGKPIDLKELFTQALALFEDIKEEIRQGSPEEKQEMLRMMSEMYKLMMVETKKICQTTGMSEEQLIAFSENPSNFTPQQWEMIQESRMKIHKAGQGLIKAMESVNKGEGGAPEKPSTVPPSSSKPTKKTKKTDWKRS